MYTANGYTKYTSLLIFILWFYQINFYFFINIVLVSCNDVTCLYKIEMFYYVKSYTNSDKNGNELECRLMFTVLP